MAAFITATRRDIPFVFYVQRGIKLEGVRAFLLSNSVPFTEESEVLADFQLRLRDGRFKPIIPA